jgi:hypothetical protein
MKTHVLLLTIVVGVGCLGNKTTLQLGSGGVGGGTVSTGVTGSGGAVAVSSAGGKVPGDAPVAGNSGGNPLPDAAQESALGGTTVTPLAGSGGVGGIASGGGLAGDMAAAGAAGAAGRAGGLAGRVGGNVGGTGGSGGQRCANLTCANWCNGYAVSNDNGCVNGYRCANGIDPCHVSPCYSDSNCPTGSTCKEKLCWPTSGTAGAVGNSGTDAGAGTVPVSIQCMGTTCAAGQICCLKLRSKGTLGCRSPSECSGELAMSCDGPEDCPQDQKCCMRLDGVQRITCTSTCLAALVICHSDADCAPGHNCCSADYTDTDDYKVCMNFACPLDAGRADGPVSTRDGR